MHPVLLEYLIKDRQNEFARTRRHSRSAAEQQATSRRGSLRLAGMRPVGLLLIRFGQWLAGLEPPSRASSAERVWLTVAMADGEGHDRRDEAAPWQ
jgi:hypothetical protein